MQFDLIKINPDLKVRFDCGAPALIGMIDTGINPDHKTFLNSRLKVDTIDAGGLKPSGKKHGTAVAALLVGDPNGRSPGLLPSARLLAIDTFHRAGKDERSDAYSLVQAMDKLANDGVRVINMSLAGPANTLLERMVEELNDRGVVIVAAAGNGGPNSAPVYPAAYDQVISVTAVDHNATVYRRAVRGEHIDFAAPGVNVWTATSISGARHKTGTSFAAPFVSAAAAVIIAQNPGITPAEVALELTRNTRDLGNQGKDETYGYGLIQLQNICK
jgi:subtilisin family serine protease